MRRSRVVLSLTILLLGTIAWPGPWRTVLAAPHSGASTAKLHCKYGTKTVTKKVNGKKKKVKVCKSKPKPKSTATPTDTPVPPTATNTPVPPTATPTVTNTSAPNFPPLVEVQPVPQTLQQGSAPFAFGQPAFYPAGTNPADMAVGDFNKDGSPDIAVIDSKSNTLSIFMNDGTGKFLPKVDYPTGNNPTAIAVGDLIGDGYPDIAVVNAGSSSVSIFINKGDGTFATPQHQAFLRRQAKGNQNQCSAATGGLAPLTRAQASPSLTGDVSLSCDGETPSGPTPGKFVVFNFQKATGSSPAPAITVASPTYISNIQLVPGSGGLAANQVVTPLPQVIPFVPIDWAYDYSGPSGSSDDIYAKGPDPKGNAIFGVYLGAGPDRKYSVQGGLIHIPGISLPTRPVATAFSYNPSLENVVFAAQRGAQPVLEHFTWNITMPDSKPTVYEYKAPFQPSTLSSGTAFHNTFVVAIGPQGSFGLSTNSPTSTPPFLSQWDATVPPAQVSFGTISMKDGSQSVGEVGAGGLTILKIQPLSLGEATYKYVGSNDISFSISLGQSLSGKVYRIGFSGGGLSTILGGPYSDGLPSGWSASATSNGVAISGSTAFPQVWSFRLGNFNPPTGTISSILFDQPGMVLGTIPVTPE